jgi:hypothetical protein
MHGGNKCKQDAKVWVVFLRRFGWACAQEYGNRIVRRLAFSVKVKRHLNIHLYGNRFFIVGSRPKSPGLNCGSGDVIQAHS